MPKNLARPAAIPGRAPFCPESIAVVSLGNPREKFWGMILALTPEGLSMSGIDLGSMEDLAVMAKQGDPVNPAILFFPMHRIERIELDLPNGDLPSLAQRFTGRTGLQPAAIFRSPLAAKSADRAKGLRAAASPRKEPA